MSKFIEMDEAVSLAAQLQDQEGGAVTLLNTFRVAPEDAHRLLAVWAVDAAAMKAQPGFISAQLHRGIAGSGVFLNLAVWQSVEHFRAAFTNPEFRANMAEYPESASISPHLVRKIEVPGICVA